ncbi:phosphate ABC transporter substrate-binding/OmpA family protein [Flavimaricola marinus]|uniref:phosphate ABC transporter substrate-binding/OmpA family protein n=1 Tax=Flavimaricola marinus TaxID=1819565 RepID=UPI001FE2B769|nr:phosphate ABC transporter substrate-binding/OmpA family protein [Flavimaricola marinus]
MELRATDGTLSLQGRVLGYDGRYLRLETAQGEITLDYAKVSCIGATCPDPDAFVDLLRFSGTGRLGGLILPAMVEGYARAHGLIATRVEETLSTFRYDLTDSDGTAIARLSFRLTTTEDGFADLFAHEADVVMAAREISPAEAEVARDAGMGQLNAPARVRILAFDALVPLVSPANPIDEIALEDLARAYAGEVTNWQALGGPDQPIELHLGNPNTGLAQGFVQNVLEATGRELSADVVQHPGDQAVVAAVLAAPNALGITSFETIGNADALPLSGPCGLRTRAGLTEVRTGDYPLTMPLFLYLPVRRLGPVAQDFIDWLNTADAQLILKRIGVPGQNAVPIPISEQGDRLAAAIGAAGDEVGLAALQRMIDAMEGHDRLTPTFRFGAGQSGLDPASRAHVRSVAQAIRDGQYAGQDLLLLGFSDGRGPASTNQRLSAARAETVRSAIVSVLGGTLPEGLTLRTVALGEALPMGCDDTVWGRQMNRRVELWAPSAPF